MNRGIIKLHTLSDTDRSRTEHNNLFLVYESGLVFTGIGGIEISDVLAGVQRIDHPENGDYTVFLPLFINFRFAEIPECSNILIRKTHLFCCL